MDIKHQLVVLLHNDLILNNNIDQMAYINLSKTT